MGNVLDDSKQHEIKALGRLGWTLLRIQAATGIRRETISGYLRAAGIPVRGRGRPSEAKPKPAISTEVSTDSPAKPAISAVGVSTDSAPPSRPGRAPSASACEPYRELIIDAATRGRNAMAIWQDLVDDHGFPARYASVRRYVLTLREQTPADARVVITTGPGEDYGEPAVMVSPEEARQCGAAFSRTLFA
jgi:transposase